MIDGFVTGIFLMGGLLILLSVIAAYGALTSYLVKKRSPLLIITAGLPALLILAGIVGAIFS